jgi:cytochrome c biogenesis protein CcmG, thiol:disulfide interchange protein DsbE
MTCEDENMQKKSNQKRSVFQGWSGFATLLILLGLFAYWKLKVESVPAGRNTALRGAIALDQPAREFSLRDIDGNRHQLRDYEGNLIFVHFWASWCAPCVVELPELFEFAEGLKDESFKIIAIALDDTWEKAHSVLPKSVPDNVIILLDPEHRSAQMYGAYQYPETFVIKPDLKLLTKWIGPQEWRMPFFTNWVIRTLASTEE